MSEFRIEQRGYREFYISGGPSDGETPRSVSVSPRSHSPVSTRGPAAAGVPQYKMGPATYRSGVYIERDNTRPPRPAPSSARSVEPAMYPSHRSQVTYHVLSESPPPPYTPPLRHSPPGKLIITPRAASPVRTYVYRTDPDPPSPQSPYQERGDVETLVPQFTAAYPAQRGTPNRVVYKSPQGRITAQVTRNKPASPSSPRPYQLKPTMDSLTSGPPGGSTSPGGGGGGAGKEAEVDALTNLLIQNMEVSGDPDFFGQCSKCGQSVMGFDNACQALSDIYHTKCFLCVTCGMCVKCGRAIMGENQGCSALDQLFHKDCFSCSSCGLSLKGKQFFAMEGKPYCEPCYMNTLEKCSVCQDPITDRILRATGKPYHPTCFTCVVCGKSLDGVQFTIDSANQIHCIEDFHVIAPRCCMCDGPIMPEKGVDETVRIVAMDRSFHVQCYKCEDCGLLLSSDHEGRGCYPLDEHILCKQCNAKRIQCLTTRMMTEL